MFNPIRRKFLEGVRENSLTKLFLAKFFYKISSIILGIVFFIFWGRDWINQNHSVPMMKVIGVIIAMVIAIWMLYSDYCLLKARLRRHIAVRNKLASKFELK